MATTHAPHQAMDVPASDAPAPSFERPQDAAAREESAPRKRSYKAFLIVGVILVAVLVGALVWWLSTRGKESTDDAELQADVVPLAPRVGGRVARVLVQENQHVRAGETILEIDDADYAVKVKQSEADVQVAQASLLRARPEEHLNAKDLARSQELIAERAIPEQQLEQAQVAARSGRAGLLQAQANVAASDAALDAARLQLSYTKVFAPADGRVSGLTAHAGQILSANEPFAQFVPDAAYVVANFKETQIGAMHPGERAAITVDAYGGRTFEARVESLSAGTGAAFSLLPPNNATGNFVKVVQRIPVRLALVNPPADLPLRAGLSADVTVYVK
jgi:membrane fusion protein (multidrug efflux system)